MSTILGLQSTRAWKTRSLIYLSNIFALLSILNILMLTEADIFTGSSATSNITLKHMTMDSTTGQLYVGAVDHIFRLNPDLSVIEEVTTGPAMDNPSCILPLDDTTDTCYGLQAEILQKISTHNINKVLLLHESNLIVCGSVFQGACQIVPKNDIAWLTSFPVSEFIFPVAANTASASTVAFVGPGPPDPANYQVMYVAITAGGVLEIRKHHNVPAVSSRNLEDTQTDFFEYAWDDEQVLQGGTYLVPETRDYYVNYVDGFSVDGYSYFLTTQPTWNDENEVQNTYVSKIIQICQSDEYYSSYGEIVLSCGDYNLVQDATISSASYTLATALGISENTDVLIAAFTKGTSTPNNVTTNESAVCIYTLPNIRQQFTTNIEQCYQGVGGMAFYLTEQATCTAQDFVTVNQDFCGQTVNPTLNRAMAGSQHLSSTQILTTASGSYTAVLTENINDYTVLYLTTSQGFFKKVVLYPDQQYVGGLEYSHELIETGAVMHKDMQLDVSRNSIYIPTTTKVYKRMLADCSQYTSCTTCLQTQDPHCGWCSLENKCSQKSECSNADRDLRWLTYPQQQCIAITLLSPMAMDIDGLTTVELSLDRLPTQDNQGYKCVFENIEYSASITGGGSGLICDTPQESAVPAIPEGEEQITITFGIMSIESGQTFLQSDFIFYSCATHAECTACTSSAFDCRWCTYNNECTYSNSACPTQTNIINAADMCPKIELLITPSLIPNGVAREIPLDARNLPEPSDDMSDYECLVHLEIPPIKVQATRVSEQRLICNEREYAYSSDEPEKIVSVDVVWNNNFYIEDTGAIEVTIYKCDKMANDCSQCTGLQTTAAQYGCRWCNTSCAFNDACSTPATDICPRPSIYEVTPLTGPLEGGTRVTISGSNLGSSYSSIQNSVLVAGEICLPIKMEYDPGKKIVCLTSAVEVEKTGELQLTIGDEPAFGPIFSYQDPNLTRVYPSSGPLAGGTELTIEGRLLNTGSNIVVHLDDRINCNDVRVDESEMTSKLVCATTSVISRKTTSTLSVQFDDATRTIDHNYSYVDDPTITGISPTTVFASGGRVISIVGTSFQSIQRPSMFIEQGTWRSDSELCTVQKNTHIECPTPAVSSDLITSRRKRREITGEPHFGFIMDAVESVQDLETHFPSVDAVVSVVPNPVYYPFPSGVSHYRGDLLVLEGDNLTLACTKEEVMVRIGEETCIIDGLTATKLLCKPPEEQPHGINAQGAATTTELPLVKVTFGFNTTVLGEIEYQTDDPMLPLPIIVAIGIGGGIFLIIIFSVLIVYHRKNKLAERKIKKMLAHLDALESSVRNECRQAFAELQTEVTDLTSDLTNQGIPFWDYHTYTSKVLFPTHNYHPILQESLDDAKDYSLEHGLQWFNQLLNSKQFLVTYIRTLESQKTFTMRDKTIVAAVLMVVLRDKMEYATEILKALLSDLIKRSVEKKNPKLLFRRTESVVEKFLTNWLSLCMYDHLKKRVGAPLFLMYKAIKLQTEKGPVDAITAEARYSLSEDRLLREKIDHNILTCQVALDHSNETSTCKLPDCCTITQAKGKVLDTIYMNTHSSQRPSIHDVDLEWRTGRTGKLPLSDEDVTTEITKGWKKINTLRHYHIPDFAKLAVVPSRNQNDLVRNVHGKVEIGSSMSSLAPIIIEEGHKPWHLVKGDDNMYQSRTQKVISELFLTRLLTTKGTIQEYVDGLFQTIFKVDNTLPTAVKYLFDFLDQAARQHNILDPEVLHAWKSNSLPLRFWVNIIKNPEFVFDIQKSDIVDSSLSVIAQAFMDSCSASSHLLGKDSPANKLLFAKDIPKYRKWVQKYYKEVSEASSLSDHDMHVAMTELSLQYVADFNITSALKELFRYADHYNYELLEALDGDPSARKLHLAHKFDQIISIVERSYTY